MAEAGALPERAGHARSARRPPSSSSVSCSSSRSEAGERGDHPRRAVAPLGANRLLAALECFGAPAATGRARRRARRRPSRSRSPVARAPRDARRRGDLPGRARARCRRSRAPARCTRRCCRRDPVARDRRATAPTAASADSRQACCQCSAPVRSAITRAAIIVPGDPHISSSEGFAAFARTASSSCSSCQAAGASVCATSRMPASPMRSDGTGPATRSWKSGCERIALGQPHGNRSPVTTKVDELRRARARGTPRPRPRRRGRAR